MMIDALQDARLVGSAQAGNESAFADLVNAHYRVVYGLAYSNLGDWAAAEDIAQETFVVAWTHLKHLHTPAAFGGWLRRIARNLTFNWRRSAKYRRALEERRDTIPGTTPSAPVSPEAAAEHAESRAEIWSALEGLSPVLREAVTLYYLEGRSVEEAARALDVTPNAIKKRLQMARGRLRRHFEERWQAEMEAERRRLADSAPPSRGVMALVALGPVDAKFALHAATAALAQGLGGVFQTLAVGGVVMSAKKLGLAFILVLLLISLWVFRDSLRAVPAVETSNNGGISLAASAETTPSSFSMSAMGSDASLEATAIAEVTSAPPEGAEGSERGVVAVQAPETSAEGPVGEITLFGRVSNDEGEPIAASNVMVLALGKGAPPIAEVAIKAMAGETICAFAESDEKGNYEITNIPFPARYCIVISARNCLSATSIFALESATLHTGARVEHSVTLRPALTIDGTLLSPKGEPVSGAVVSLEALVTPNGVGGGGRAPMTCAAISGADGGFALPVPCEGKGLIGVDSRAFPRAAFPDVELVNGKSLLLTLPAAARIHGRLSRTDGQPAAGYRVVLYCRISMGPWREDTEEVSSGFSATSNYQEFVTGVDGAVRAEGLLSGLPYSAEIKQSDGQLLTSVEIGTLAPGEDREWNFTVADNVVVTGMVRGETTGAPLGGITVECVPVEGGQKVADAMQRVETGADGRFTLSVARGEGEYSLSPKYGRGGMSADALNSTSRAAAVTLRKGSNPPLMLTLPEPWTWTVPVIDSEGNAVPHVSISVTEKIGDSGNYGYQPKYTLQGSEYVLTGLPPNAELSLWLSYPPGYADTYVAPHVGKPGEAFRSEPVVMRDATSIRATLVDSDGNPLVGWQATLRTVESRDKIMPILNGVGPEGNVLFENLPSSTPLRFRIEARSSDVTQPPVYAETGEATLESGQTFDLGVVTMLAEE